MRYIRKMADSYYKVIDWQNGEDGWIYFIQMENSGPIKIGYAKDVKKRLSQLQIGNPFKLNVLLKIPGSVLGEKDYHNEFRNINVKGEWFWPHKNLLSFIESAKEHYKKLRKSMEPEHYMKYHGIDPKYIDEYKEAHCALFDRSMPSEKTLGWLHNNQN